jgi:hypothetical protein
MSSVLISVIELASPALSPNSNCFGLNNIASTAIASPILSPILIEQYYVNSNLLASTTLSPKSIVLV